MHQLLSELNENMNESEFIDFIFEKLINKMPNDHVRLKISKWISEDDHKIENENISEITEPFKNDNVEINFIDNTIIIKIKSFSHKQIDKDKYIYQNLEQYLQENETDNIIIDIRGNGGGSDGYFRLFSIFTDEDINFNEATYDLFMQQVLSFDWTPIPKGNNSKHYNKFLLIDNNVFSTADKLANYCKQTGYATLIGEQTKGEGIGLTPHKLKLIEGVYQGKYAKKIREEKGAIVTQIILNYPTGAPINEHEEIDYENFYNTKPDIECFSEDALDVALKITNKNKRL